MEKVRQFQQLKAWQEAHKLVLSVYEITKQFPTDERFGLVSQMRRAAVSIPANIAEGFKRRSIQEKVRFYNISEGSLEELKYYFILSKDLEYISDNNALMAQTEDAGRLLYGLISSTERRQANGKD
jgi:four helix bundle protein